MGSLSLPFRTAETNSASSGSQMLRCRCSRAPALGSEVACLVDARSAHCLRSLRGYEVNPGLPGPAFSQRGNYFCY
jgi:hypothetical protein